MTVDIIIVTPVYNDWDSFSKLVKELKDLNDINIVQIVAVDDGSTDQPNSIFNLEIPITVLELNTNLGHQRAISIGLAYVQDCNVATDYVVVMDCDGEDRPEDIKGLIDLVDNSNAQSIGFAKREKRTEGLVFKFFYRIYKILFFALTSKKLKFGNFSCMPKAVLEQVVSLPDIWNHYSGGIMKSKLQYTSVGTDKGKRYAGSSKMNFQNLVLHGLSSVAVYLEIVTIRLFFFSLTLIILSILPFGVIILIGQLHPVNFPIWFWLILIAWVFILLVVILISFFLLLSLLNQRASRKEAIKSFYKDYINSVQFFNTQAEEI